MKAILRSGFLALAVIALAVPANAGPYEDGMAAAEREDYETALKKFRLLTEQGHATAQNNLGLRYYYAGGVQKNDIQVYKWSYLAAAQGYTDAIKRLESLETKMTPAQVAEAQRLARKWRPKK